MTDTCSRCSKPVTDEVWCTRHYKQWLSEWSCNCGEINGGSINRLQAQCGFCKEPRKE